MLLVESEKVIAEIEIDIKNEFRRNILMKLEERNFHGGTEDTGNKFKYAEGRNDQNLR